MSTLYVEHITEVHFHRAGVLTVGNDKYKRRMLHDFEVLGYGGFLETLGTGEGTSTDVQIRNETRTPDLDLFATVPTFEVNSATNLLEGGALITPPHGYANDLLCLDIDAIPGDANAADVDVWLICRFFIQATP